MVWFGHTWIMTHPLAVKGFINYSYRSKNVKMS